MIPPVDTKDPKAVARFVQRKRAELFGRGKSPWLARVLAQFPQARHVLEHHEA